MRRGWRWPPLLCLLLCCFNSSLLLLLRWHGDGWTRLAVVHNSPGHHFKLEPATRRWANCSLAKCLDLRRCLLHPDRRLSIHIQPILRVVDKSGNVLNCAEPSSEFLAIRRFLLRSGHNEPDAAKACLVLPGLDTLSLLNCPAKRLSGLLEAAKSLLPPNSNLLLLNLLISPHQLGHPFPFPAIFASAQHSSRSIRPAMDLSLPLPALHFPPSTLDQSPSNTSASQRPIDILAIIFERKMSRQEAEIVEMLGRSHLRVEFGVKCVEEEGEEGGFFFSSATQPICGLESGKRLGQLDQLISSSKLVLVSDSSLVPFPQMLVWLALRWGAIPLVLSEQFVPPFREQIDWSLFSLHFFPSLLPELPQLLRAQSPGRLERMRVHGATIFHRHFSSLDAILDSLLAALETKLIPGRVRTRAEWNQHLT